MASPSVQLPPPASSSAWERRLHAEWDLLTRLVTLNPTRLAQPVAADSTFFVTLLETPALPATAPAATAPASLRTHRLRLQYPPFFPAVPLELYLETPVFHPNVHPLTGFVCLWDRHSPSYTVEHALHKTARMLGWTLRNVDPRHTMQAEAQALDDTEAQALAQRLHAPPLAGLEPFSSPCRADRAEPATAPPRRRRLS